MSFHEYANSGDYVGWYGSAFSDGFICKSILFFLRNEGFLFPRTEGGVLVYGFKLLGVEVEVRRRRVGLLSEEIAIL